MSPLLHNPNFFHVVPDAVVARPDLVRPMQVVEREQIERALILCEGDRLLAAKQLGISKTSLYRWIKRFRNEQV